jgi:hypothetical protein
MESFNLDKMLTRLTDGHAHYQLQMNQGQTLELNQFVGKNLKIHYKNVINCTHCQRATKKSFSGGYCYPCSIKLAECDMCILKPELCHFARGTCREASWGEANCMIPHYVYLANSSGLKVGITRTSQIPHRWMDQGAVAALPIMKVSTRLQSGQFEKLFSTEINDKTDWRKMLKGEVVEIDLDFERDQLFDSFGEAIDELEDQIGAGQIELLEKAELTEIKYPVLEYPQKVSSLSLDKNPVVGGLLRGIKGQYLIFDTGVINIRSHTGYKVEIEF